MQKRTMVRMESLEAMIRKNESRLATVAKKFGVRFETNPELEKEIARLENRLRELEEGRKQREQERREAEVSQKESEAASEEERSAAMSTQAKSKVAAKANHTIPLVLKAAKALRRESSVGRSSTTKPEKNDSEVVDIIQRVAMASQSDSETEAEFKAIQKHDRETEGESEPRAEEEKVIAEVERATTVARRRKTEAENVVLSSMMTDKLNKRFSVCPQIVELGFDGLRISELGERRSTTLQLQNVGGFCRFTKRPPWKSPHTSLGKPKMTNRPPAKPPNCGTGAKATLGLSNTASIETRAGASMKKMKEEETGMGLHGDCKAGTSLPPPEPPDYELSKEKNGSADVRACSVVSGSTKQHPPPHSYFCEGMVVTAQSLEATPVMERQPPKPPSHGGRCCVDKGAIGELGATMQILNNNKIWEKTEAQNCKEKEMGAELGVMFLSFWVAACWKGGTHTL